MVRFVLPDGDVIPVPADVVSQGNAAQQAFYDSQIARQAVEAPAAGDSSSTPAAPAGGSDA